MSYNDDSNLLYLVWSSTNAALPLKQWKLKQIVSTPSLVVWPTNKCEFFEVVTTNPITHLLCKY